MNHEKFDEKVDLRQCHYAFNKFLFANNEDSKKYYQEARDLLNSYKKNRLVTLNKLKFENLEGGVSKLCGFKVVKH